MLGGGRYHSTLNIGLSQYFKSVLLYLSFVIFFLLNSKSVYADTSNTFKANFPKTITTLTTYTKNTEDGTEQYLLTINKDTGVNSVTVKVGSTIISPVTSGGNTYWIDKGANPTVEATAKSGYKITDGTGSTGVMNDIETVNITSELTVAALIFSSDSNFTLSVTTKGWDGTLQYSTNNGSSWATWDGSQLSGTTTQPIYLRGTNNTKITGDSKYRWTFNGKYCTGNIETLLDYKKVMNGQHPVMVTDCYEYMFKDCTALTTAPELPATTLAKYCYSDMFSGCKSLTTVPELPATTLADGCYSGMFAGCTSLTTAPQLPATTLASNCYFEMFWNCTSLTTAPVLPATTLTSGCYGSMFQRCTSLTTAPALSTTTLARYCYTNMFQGCTSLVTAPELPATTLEDNCYEEMFEGCTSLVTAPELPATTLVFDCYTCMFKDCTKLKVREGGSGKKIFTCPSTASLNVDNMFTDTGGTFTGTPTKGKTYYYY